MNVFLAGLAHETNSFSPLPTTMRSFEEGILYQPDGTAEALQSARNFPGFGHWLDTAFERGEAVVIGPCAWAQPGGLVARPVYEALRENVLDALRAAPAIDAVVLVLHGAMMAHGYPDCEGDLLTRVRALVGPQVPVGVLLDLHGNVTPAMIDSGAVLIACKEYPHTDYLARTRELYDILGDMCEGACKPQVIMQRVPVLGLFGTTEGPMRGFVDRLAGFEQLPGMLSISVMHGFPWSDAEATSAAVLVFYRAGNGDAAAAVADRISRELFAMRSYRSSSVLTLERALEYALVPRAQGQLVVLADVADNPGGGAAGDSTFVLRALIECKAQDVALGMIWDPQAVQIAIDAGVGALIPLRIGGKIGKASGDPVDVLAQVTAVRHDARQHGLGGSFSEALGSAVALRVDGIEIVLNTIRQQVFSKECFSQLGIDVLNKRLVVVKSTRHFRAWFDAIAAETIFCETAGTLNGQLASLPYRQLRRPIWPLDEVSDCGHEQTIGARHDE
jgi:microcystin degradation protein MlrC